MKTKRLLAFFMVLAMILSLAACANDGTTTDGTSDEGTVNTVAEGTDAVKQDAAEAAASAPVQKEIVPSIDFEDGNYGFALISTSARKADDSVISVKDFNGSKALYVENQGKAETYVAFGVDGLLGSRAADVRKIAVTVAVDFGAARFAPVGGEIWYYTGENNAVTKSVDWVIYMKNKSTRTFTFDLPKDVAFAQGFNNYFVLSAGDLSGSTITNLAIDNIAFLDASDNTIAVDTKAVFTAPEKGFYAVAEEEDESDTASVKVACDENYAGDWGQSGIIPVEVLAQFSSGCDVTYKFELEPNYDYYLYGVMDASWTKLIDKTGITVTAKTDGEDYHLQNDGFIVIDNFDATELTLHLSAETVAELVAAGSGLSAQTYGVNAYEAVISGEAASQIKASVDCDESYAGDWGQSGIIPVEVLAQFTEGCDVTYKFELEPNYDYYLYGVMDASWTKLIDKTGITVTAKTDGEDYHLQSDGFIVIDNFDATELTLHLSAATVAELVAAGSSLSAQTYGVNAYKAVLVGDAPAMIRESVDCDESYAGDWGQSGIIPVEVLAQFKKGCDVTYKFDLEPNFDYYLYGVMDASWTKLIDKTGITVTAKTDGEDYHLQSDGFIVIDNFDATELTLHLSAETVAELVAAGSGLSAQTYGVNAYKAVLVGPAKKAQKVKVAGEEAYAGDWGQSGLVNADVLGPFTDGCDVTFKFDLEPNYDYYLYGVMDAGWNKLVDKTGITVTAKTEGEDYHLQSDGFIVIDNFDATQLTVHLSAETVAELITGGSLSAQTYGVNCYEIVIVG